MVFRINPQKSVQFGKERLPMYRAKDRKTQVLFPELFPFRGKLDERNRWLRIEKLIPWEELEIEYRRAFSPDFGRPAKDAQLVIGLLLLKHMTGLSDRDLIAEVLENPYMQAFCGFRSMATEETLEASTLSKIRQKLGLGFFRELERRTYEVLIDRRIIKAKGMLQYVRRNLGQLRDLLQRAKIKRKKNLRPLWERLHVAEEIFRQQWEMYKRKTCRIANRIVSMHRPYVRPIKTGKLAQDTEFGAKGALVHVDGFLFLDHFKHEAFNEAELAVRHVAGYEERFGKLPPYFVADHKYGSQKNREDLDGLKIRTSFKPLGRASREKQADPWFKAKQRERNRIEGAFGNGKEHYGLDGVQYVGEEGSEIWARTSLLAMNLKTALRRV